MKLVSSLMNFECQLCGIFEGLSYHQEDEAIEPITFAATVGLGNIIKKLVSSKCMGTVSSVSVIFDIGDTYSCSSLQASKSLPCWKNMSKYLQCQI